MSVLAPRNTLRFQLYGRALASSLLLRDRPLSKVITDLNGYKGGAAKPETEALWFYMMNHAVKIIRDRVGLDDELPPEYLAIVESYNEHAIKSSLRMFNYLMRICTRETRHVHDTGVYSSNKDDCKFAELYGKEIWKFLTTIDGTGSDTAVQRLLAWKPQNVSLGQYTSSMTWIFYHGKYSGGFGGKAWGNVADCLNEYVQGTTTAEMMMDTSFTLCHNNGPIFNKGMQFEHYDGGAILRILDVQRAGMIPQLVGNKEVNPNYISYELGLEYQKCAKALGDEFKGHVDWYLVEELGSKGKYPKEKQIQESKYGLSAKHAEIVAQKKAEIEAKKMAEFKKTFQVGVAGIGGIHTIMKTER